MEESAKKIEALAMEAPREHGLIFLAHNGPAGRMTTKSQDPAHIMPLDSLSSQIWSRFSSLIVNN
jgi:hypothetical protein